MIYFVSDIHGCYSEYMELLDAIRFSEKDEMYVLGDAMDRGPEPIKVILDIMSRPNIHYILGNHDHMMLKVLSSAVMKEITEKSIEEICEKDLLTLYDWISNGGEVTLEQYRLVDADTQKEIIQFLSESPCFEMLIENSVLYILVHAGISNFQREKELDEYDSVDFLWERMDYTRDYYQSSKIYIVSGHTPTFHIREDKDPLVYENNHHIAIDCGCVWGGNLAVYCLDTGEVTYIQSKTTI